MVSANKQIIFIREKASAAWGHIKKTTNMSYVDFSHDLQEIIPDAQKLAQEYLEKYPNKEEACKAMLKNQVAHSETSESEAHSSGIKALPSNIKSAFYTHIRMIACAAYIAGYDLNTDDTRTLIHECLTGVRVVDPIKKIFVTLGESSSAGLIKKIPGKHIDKVNKTVGSDFISKAGSAGTIILSDIIPQVGLFISSAIDGQATKTIADRAYKQFFEHTLSIEAGSEGSIEIIELSEEDIIEEIEKD